MRRGARPPATGAEHSQTPPAHIHCSKSLWSSCPCRQEFRVDSILLLSYLCQLYLISGIASAREIPVICVGGVCGPQKSSQGPVLTPGYGLAAPMGLQPSLPKRWELPNVGFAMFGLCCFSAGFLRQSTHLQTAHDGKKKSRQ